MNFRLLGDEKIFDSRKDFRNSTGFLSSDMTKQMTVLAYSNDLGNVSSRFVKTISCLVTMILFRSVFPR